ERMGSASATAAPFPPVSAPPTVIPALSIALDLVTLGLLSDASAEADWFVQHHPGDAGAAALAVYQRASRYDRSVLLAESLLGGRGPHAPRPLLDAAYPAAFPAEVGASASRTRVDPYLLLAVMRRESLFKPETRSAAGAVGLLQLLPATARRAARRLGAARVRDSAAATHRRELLEKPLLPGRRSPEDGENFGSVLFEAEGVHSFDGREGCQVRRVRARNGPKDRVRRDHLHFHLSRL